jgi:hypothetical protein
MNYFDHPYCSNSDLSRLQQELSGRDAVEFASQLHFGKLFHAMLLEPNTIDHIRLMIGEESFTKEEFILAKKMRDAVRADRFCMELLRDAEMEKEMYNENTAFMHNHIEFSLPTRRKYDFWKGLVNWGGDFKSTTARSQEQFISAIQQFDYDRARVFYAKGSGAMKDVIVGVSKYHPHKIFPVFMRTGCPLWESGDRKTNELAYKYWALKQSA